MKLNTSLGFICIFIAQFSLAKEPVKAKVTLSKGTFVSTSIHDSRINVDFPEPTDIRDIAKAFSLWFGTNYVVDERARKKVKLISPELVSKAEGLKRFYGMLARNNLKIIETSKAKKIVPIIE